MSKSSQNKEKKTPVYVLGLGYVGLTLSVVFAEEGFDVYGVDKNERVTKKLKEGIPHFYEPELEERMIAQKDRLHFSQDLRKISDPAVYVVAVGSSVDEFGVPDYAHIEDATNDIGNILKKGDLVILRSTVTIGTTRRRVIPVLERSSNLTAGKDFFVAFAPERTIEGKALEELRTLPQMIAGYTRTCRDHAEGFFANISERIILLETLEEAELGKLVSNSYRDLSFAFSNAIALIASEHNINVHRVISSANEGYPRNNIPLPSPGVGGYCLTKDPLLLAYGAQKYTEASNLLKEGRIVNQKMVLHVSEIVRDYINKFSAHTSPHVVIIGLAFKGSPVTSDVRFSPSQFLVDFLKKQHIQKISAYDPHVSSEVFTEWGIGKIEDINQISQVADIVIFMHRNNIYREYIDTFFRDSKSEIRTTLVLDPWGMYNQIDGSGFANGQIKYANLGYRSFPD